jgi:hypothetical protein
VIARGDTATIRRRIDEPWAAAAGHVYIQALNSNEGRPAPPDEQPLAALSPKA